MLVIRVDWRFRVLEERRGFESGRLGNCFIEVMLVIKFRVEVLFLNLVLGWEC